MRRVFAVLLLVVSLIYVAIGVIRVFNAVSGIYNVSTSDVPAEMTPGVESFRDQLVQAVLGESVKEYGIALIGIGGAITILVIDNRSRRVLSEEPLE